MRLKPRIVASVLAAILTVSLLEYPSATVMAGELPQETVNVSDVNDKTVITDKVEDETTSNKAQNQEQDEIHDPANKDNANADGLKNNDNTEKQEPGAEDDNTPGAEENAGDNTAEGNEDQKEEDINQDKLNGDIGNVTDDANTGDTETLPDIGQNPDKIQDDLEIDAETDEVKKELADNDGIALTSERIYSGDDYPEEYRNLAGDAVVDKWNFYNRECTSFVAWRLNSRNGIHFTNQYMGVDRWGHAKDWGGVAQSLGITVDMNPAVGAVAWSSSGDYGHVAWVSAVDGDSVTVEEYNGPGHPFSYQEREVSWNTFDGYIHIADISETPDPKHWTLDDNGVLTIYDDEGMPGWDGNVGTQFSGQEEAKSIILKENVTSIKSSAFVDFSNLTSIVIPNSVTAIGALAFQRCNRLTRITIPSSVTSIERLTFSYCSSLNYITIPGSITSIGDNAFAYCSNMNRIFIPNTVTSIGYGAFYKCDKLTDVYYGGSKSEWEAIQINQGMNECLANAAVHYNSSGMESDNGDDPTLIVQGRTFEFTSPGSVVLNWGWNYILNRNSTDYINDVATAALALSAAAERSQGAIESMLAGDNFGADLIKSVHYNESISNIYKPACTFAHKTISNGGKIEHIIVIVARGTSSFADGITDYNSITDNFRITADNIWHDFAEWVNVEEVGNEKLTSAISKGNVKFFVTGHSLGGAVANRIAYKLNQVYGSENVYAYTFASPPTEGQNSTTAHNIFNFLCHGDPVPYCGAFTDGRYGTDLWFADSYYSCQIHLTTFFDNHQVGHYMSHLQDISNYRFRKTVKSGGVRCPVDLRIYNSSGQLVGSVTDNTVDKENITDAVIIVLSGENNDEKNFYFLTDDTYTIELIGTDDGTLTYVIRDTYADKNTIIEKKYANVNLYDGKVMTSIVSAWDIDDTSIDTSNLISTPDTRLLVLDDSGNPVKEVLDDGNGTEVPIDSKDDSDNKPSDNTDNNADNSNRTQSSHRTSSKKVLEGQIVVETWKPTTPDEKKRYACMGKDVVQYTLPKDNAYHIVIENAMQGPMCFKSFEAVLSDYTIGRTYNVYTLPNNAYSKDEEIQFTIQIPSDIYKKDREYKMICVTKGGLPIVYNDIDSKPETITIKTDKFYAYALIYK